MSTPFECPESNHSVFNSTILFECARGQNKLEIFKEDWLNCTVEILFTSEAVCDMPNTTPGGQSEMLCFYCCCIA
eukprot:m.27556 g.27556  ORF g.27556 m.27556 type:complete len:75 (+) comp7906_c0_seq3:129-353(+)